MSTKNPAKPAKKPTVNANLFKVGKFNKKEILAAATKAGKYVSGKPVNFWVDYDLFETNIPPIKVKAFSKKYKVFLENAKDTDVISKLSLVQSTYEGILSIVPLSADDDDFESYVNLLNADFIDYQMDGKVKEYNDLVLNKFIEITGKNGR